MSFREEERLSLQGLLGKRVVVTRSEAQALELCERLRALDAEPIAFPVIRFEPLEAPELDELTASEDLAGFDWLVLTSVNAVEHLFGRLEGNGPAARHALPRIAVVGAATARAVRALGLEPDIVPDEFSSAALLQSLLEGGASLEGCRVLLPRSRLGRPEIVRGLEELGASVRELALYDTVRVDPRPEAVEELRRGFDAVTFTSPSSVRNFLAILEDQGLERRLVEEAVVACIGPVTAEEARANGLVPEVVPDEYTVPDLVVKLAQFLAARRDGRRIGAEVDSRA